MLAMVNSANMSNFDQFGGIFPDIRCAVLTVVIVTTPQFFYRLNRGTAIKICLPH